MKSKTIPIAYLLEFFMLIVHFNRDTQAIANKVGDVCRATGIRVVGTRCWTAKWHIVVDIQAQGLKGHCYRVQQTGTKHGATPGCAVT